MFNRLSFKKSLLTYFDNNPNAAGFETNALIQSGLITKDDYLEFPAEIEEIYNWYHTMHQERSETHQWYHTIEFNDGSVSEGMYDHRPYLKYYGFPSTLSGKRVLDVGPATGFFSFYFEKLGAKEVVALEAYENPDFLEAKDRLNSNVKYHIRNVYDLNPKELGQFDFIFCGTVLCHLSDPFKALSNIRHVLANKGAFYCATVTAKLPWYIFPFNILLNRLCYAKLCHGRASLGAVSTYWFPTENCFKEMLFKSGFDRIDKISEFLLPEKYNLTNRTVSYPHIVFRNSIDENAK